MCTNFVIPHSQAVVSARTLDFDDIIPTDVTVVPRGYSFPFFLKKWFCSKALSWQAKYGFVGMSVRAFPMFSDGLNEQGLSAAALWLSQADYPPCSEASDDGSCLLSSDVVGWILSNFKTVEDVKEGIKEVTVANPYHPFFHGLLEEIPEFKKYAYLGQCLHFMVTDNKQNSLVIEYVKQGDNSPTVTFYDDPKPGVMTNSPTYDWHLTNLSNYENLGIKNCTQKWWGEEIDGSGMLGLPGDGTPPSRFIRAAKMLETQFSPSDEQSAVSLALRILGVCLIPKGTTVLSTDDKKGDFTQWICARDHTNLKYFYQYFKDEILRCICLNDIDFSTVQYKKTSIENYSNWYQDETKSLTNK